MQPRASFAEITRSGADAVQGPVFALCCSEAPDWIRNAGFRDVLPVFRPEDRFCAGCIWRVVFRLNRPLLQDGSIALAIGLKGGEDDDFVRSLVRDGGTIRYAQAAISQDDIPPAWPWLGLVLRRNLLARRAQGRINAIEGRSARGAMSAGAASKVAVRLAFAGFAEFTPARRTRAPGRVSLRAGLYSTLLGGNHERCTS